MYLGAKLILPFLTIGSQINTSYNSMADFGFQRNNFQDMMLKSKKRTELICRPTNFYTRFLRPTKESSVKTRITSARPAFNYFWITTFWSGRRILVSSFLDSFSVYISLGDWKMNLRKEGLWQDYL